MPATLRHGTDARIRRTPMAARTTTGYPQCRADPQPGKALRPWRNDGRITRSRFFTALSMNRSLLTALVATNVLGQNSAAIAATETDYAAMWAQDAAAMYGWRAAVPDSASARLGQSHHRGVDRTEAAVPQLRPRSAAPCL